MGLTVDPITPNVTTILVVNIHDIAPRLLVDTPAEDYLAFARLCLEVERQVVVRVVAGANRFEEVLTILRLVDNQIGIVRNGGLIRQYNSGRIRSVTIANGDVDVVLRHLENGTIPVVALACERCERCRHTRIVPLEQVLLARELRSYRHIDFHTQPAGRLSLQDLELAGLRTNLLDFVIYVNIPVCPSVCGQIRSSERLAFYQSSGEDVKVTAITVIAVHIQAILSIRGSFPCEGVGTILIGRCHQVGRQDIDRRNDEAVFMPKHLPVILCVAFYSPIFHLERLGVAEVEDALIGGRICGVSITLCSCMQRALLIVVVDDSVATLRFGNRLPTEFRNTFAYFDAGVMRTIIVVFSITIVIGQKTYPRSAVREVHDFTTMLVRDDIGPSIGALQVVGIETGLIQYRIVVRRSVGVERSFEATTLGRRHRFYVLTFVGVPVYPDALADIHAAVGRNEYAHVCRCDTRHFKSLGMERMTQRQCVAPCNHLDGVIAGLLEKLRRECRLAGAGVCVPHKSVRTLDIDRVVGCAIHGIPCDGHRAFLVHHSLDVLRDRRVHFIATRRLGDGAEQFPVGHLLTLRVIA